MKNKKYCIVIALWAALTVLAWFLPARAESDSERRPLARLPELSGKSILSGSFMEKFEDYTLDQFPLRDGFRGIKALFHTYVLGQQDTNGIYLAEGHGAKMEYPLNVPSVNRAIGRFAHLYEKYLTESKVYFALVPDKGYFLAEKSGRMSLDYERLCDMVEEGMPWAQPIDLRGSLQLADYYFTDTHWRQERLLPAAGAICEAMGVTPPQPEDYTQTTLPRPFYGVYYGQAALPMEPEQMHILESKLLADCTVYDHETGKTGAVYDLEKLDSRDLYDVYLSGARALLTVKNPQGDPEKELIVFRDSFGSSLVPLLLHDYGRVTLVDIRYISSDLLDRFISFRGQDVLLLYSTLILNNSSALK